MGRPALPTNVHKLKGTEKKHPDRMRKRGNEPKPKAPLGQPPRNLPANVKKCWRELIRLAPPGVFGDSDRWAVEIAATLMAEFRAANMLMPSARIARLDSLLARFGMTPSDRTKVQVPPEKPKNRFDD